MDDEGVGGFLESILAVMVVITASSVFMVVLASGTLQMDEGIEQKDVVTWLKTNGLYSEDEGIRLEGSNEILDRSDLLEGISGITIVYRRSGDPAPLLVLDRGGPPRGDVLAFQLPLLIELDGRGVPGVMEVRAWR